MPGKVNQFSAYRYKRKVRGYTYVDLTVAPSGLGFTVRNNKKKGLVVRLEATAEAAEVLKAAVSIALSGTPECGREVGLFMQDARTLAFLKQVE